MDSKYFTVKELACKCGCGKMNTSIKTILMLDRARGLANIPFKINSGCRCYIHNRKVKGRPTSSHLKGEAFDISATTSSQRYLILTSLLEAGFTRIGIADTFIHVDNDIDKAPNVIWTY